MAESVLTTVAEGILKKLGSLFVQEIGPWWSVKDELKKLERTVSSIQAVLLDADKQPAMSNQVKNYIDNLEEALYDADDLLDDFSTKALRQRVMSRNNTATLVRNFFSSLTQPFYGRNMANKIKAIREKLDAIKADKEFLVGKELLIGEVSVGQQVVPRETQPYIFAEEVIGRDDDKVKIIELLMGSNSEGNVSIILIVGMGGLGKTALARLVYNDDKIENHFDKKLWVCVSDVFDVKTIVKNIIKSATGTNPADLESDQLQFQLRKELDGKKYLLVLEDVWEEDRKEWLELAKLLMGGAKGSCVVVTTRSGRVAEITSTVSPHVLEGLSEIDSWSLFARMAFEQGEEPTNQSIIAIGKEIVEICGGIPLAIRMMGNHLYRKSESEWTYLKNERSYLSIDRILPTLKVSYNNLEPHLKHCFAYCSLFPKDYGINVKKLIYLWIAQGFIKSSNSSQSLEQIGYEYFRLLLWRSFFRDPEEGRELGNVVRCKMHDLMHDLAVEVAGEGSIMLSSDKEIKSAKNTRHVSIDDRGYHLSSKTLDLFEANKIRTLLFPSTHWFSSEEVEIVSEFRRLHMLDLHELGMKTLPELIGELKHLRYLDLSGSYMIEMLPRSIERLQNLVVLDLSYCKRLKELPEQIGKLVSLVILELDGCRSLSHMPEGLGQLTSLQKLTRFVVSKDDSVSKKRGGLNELNGLNNLTGELKLVNLGHVKNADLYKAANLERKQHLQTLILEWGLDEDKDGDVDTMSTEGSDEVTRLLSTVDAMSMEGLQPHMNLKKLHVSGYPGVRCPSWLSSLTNLVNLKLDYCVRVKYLPPLDGLSSLRHLCIRRLDDLEYINCNGSNCFRATFFSSLEELKIHNCSNLKGWRIETSSSTTELPQFPCLSKLKIKECPNLTLMPLFPTIEGKLELVFASGKPLQQTMMMKSKEVSSSSSSPLLPLSKLKSLWIQRINDLDQGMWNLTSLESLWIVWCDGLLSLAGEGFSGLTSLRSLGILQCCDNLTTLPDWIGSLTSLQQLDIYSCFKFTSLPEGIRGLTSLQKLTIKRCPQLSERCRNNMGGDWHKIAHIPNIEIDDTYIQLEGCYQLG